MSEAGKQSSDLRMRQAYNRRIRWKSIHGIELTTAQALLPEEAVCEICGREKATDLDHCHTAKMPRGWLCGGCNTLLSRAKDDPGTLAKAIKYLEKYGTS
jgi:hypothetical protein